MPERLHDARIANEIANLPEVAPFLMADHDFDFSDAVKDDRTIFLHDSGGIAIFSWSAPRVYEVHLFFRGGHRGRPALEACQRMIDWMVPDHADVLWAQPPKGLKAPLWVGLKLGFKKAGEFAHPLLGPVQYIVRGAV